MARSSSVPSHIGKYELGEQLGRGTCGTVYRAFDPFVGRDVALKLAHPGATEQALSDQRRRTFFSEAYAAGQLAHPHIVSVYDAGIEGAYSYIVMEYVPGHTLREWGRAGADPLARERSVEIVFRCCQALDYAHRRGVIHRDVKPGNIMVTTQGTTKINDFSIALMTARGDCTTPGVAEGTPHYMAPEQVRGVDVSPGTDIYALGAVLFELITGRCVVEEPDLQQLFRTIRQTPPPKISDYVADCPDELVRIVDRALAKRAEDRFASATEMAAALGRVHERERRTGRRLAAGQHSDQLRGIDFFAGFTDAEAERVLEAGTLLQYSAGEPIIREGDLDTSFYLIVVGSATVAKGGTRIETLGRGDCFGEMGFLSEARRSASITADRDVVVLRVTKSQLDMAPAETQLLYYHAFTETLIYRLTVTSARLAAALQSVGQGRRNG